MKIWLALALTVSVNCSIQQVVLAQSNDTSSADSTKTPASTPASSSNPNSLSMLKEIGDACHHIRNCTKDMVSESETTDLLYVGNASFGGLTGGGFAPLRKKWVDYYMHQFSFLMPELTNNVTGLNPPADLHGAAELSSDMKYELSNIEKPFAQLGSDTKGPQYVNADIARDAQSMNMFAERIERDKKELEKLLKKSSK